PSPPEDSVSPSKTPPSPSEDSVSPSKTPPPPSEDSAPQSAALRNLLFSIKIIYLSTISILLGLIVNEVVFGIFISIVIAAGGLVGLSAVVTTVIATLGLPLSIAVFVVGTAFLGVVTGGLVY